MKSEAYQYINKFELAKTLGLSSVQQMLTALSTYCLIRAGLSYDEPTNLLLWCVASFVFHLLSPAVQVLVKKWEYDLHFEAYRSFMQRNLFSKKGQSLLWRRKDLKDSYIASLGNDGESHLGALLFVGLDVFAFLTSILFGVLVLGGTLDVGFIPAFILSALLSFLFYRLMSKQVERDFQKEQDARTSFNGYILNAWDNVFIKNQSINSRYQETFNSRLTLTKEATKKSAGSSEFLVFVLGVVSALPILGCIIWLGLNNINNNEIAALLALLATVPRQLTILTTMRSLFQNMTAFIGFNSKFSVIHKDIQIESIDHRQQIQVKKLTLASVHHESLEQLERTIQNLKPGRYEVRGANGCGKSTLLLHLNATVADTFYLPAHPNLEIGNLGVALSSGEGLLKHIDYLRTESESILLLDEWDANLDRNNILKTEVLLNELAQSKVIIEVRHRETSVL